MDTIRRRKGNGRLRTSSQYSRSGAGDLRGEVGVLAREFRLVAEREADADRGSRAPGHRNPGPAPMPMVGMCKFLRDARGEFARHGFEHDGKSARRFDGARVALDLARSVGRLALHVKSAEGVHAIAA